MLVNKNHKILSFILIEFKKNSLRVYRKSVHVYKSCNSHPLGYIGLLKLCMSCSNERFVCSAPKPDRCECTHDRHKHIGFVLWGGGGHTRPRPSQVDLITILLPINWEPLSHFVPYLFCLWCPEAQAVLFHRVHRRLTSLWGLCTVYSRCISFAHLSNKQICTKIKKGRLFFTSYFTVWSYFETCLLRKRKCRWQHWMS